MLYTKYRKIKKSEITGVWGDFDTWEDFGETWGDWEYEWQSYTFAWLKVSFKIKNVLKKVNWIGYEGLIKYLGEFLPESFYRRWGWFKWDEIFKEKIFVIVFGSFVEPIIINQVSLATYLKIKNLFNYLFHIIQINVSDVIITNNFVDRILSALSCQVNSQFDFNCQIINSYRWGDFETWGDFPNDRWAPLWSIT
jgi:hypothetical protein